MCFIHLNWYWLKIKLYIDNRYFRMCNKLKWMRWHDCYCCYYYYYCYSYYYYYYYYYYSNHYYYYHFYFYYSYAVLYRQNARRRYTPTTRSLVTAASSSLPISNEKMPRVCRMKKTFTLIFVVWTVIPLPFYYLSTEDREILTLSENSFLIVQRRMLKTPGVISVSCSN